VLDMSIMESVENSYMPIVTGDASENTNDDFDYGLRL